MISPTVEEVDRAVKAALNGQRTVRTSPAQTERCFSGRLLSASVVESLTESTTELSIGPETVLTPMARELLKRRGIALRLMGRAEARRGSRAGEWGFVVDSVSWSATSLKRLLLMTDDWLELGSGVESLAKWVSEQNDRGGALFTDEGALAVWRANRIDGVRAASASDADGISRAVSSMGANLVVVEPTGKSLYELKHLASTFRKAGAPVPPEWIEGDTIHAHRRGDWPRDAFPKAFSAEESPVRGRVALANGRVDGGIAHAR